MDNAIVITDELDAATRRIIAAMAHERGISVAAFSGEMIRQAIADEAELLAIVQQGRQQIAAGSFVTHEELVAQIAHWKQEQRRAA